MVKLIMNTASKSINKTTEPTDGSKKSSPYDLPFHPSPIPPNGQMWIPTLYPHMRKGVQVSPHN